MIIAVIAAFVMIYLYNSTKISDACGEIKYAERLFRSIVFFEAIILVVTNLLSVFGILTKTVDFIAWLIVSFIFAFLYGKNRADVEKNKASFWRLLKEKFGSIYEEGKVTFVAMAALLFVLSLILLFGAIFTVPYNYDSMTYHLARIGYWIDHQSVAHYVTNIDRQVYSPVLAEYNLLHIILLCGNDTFANFLQFFSSFLAAYFIYHCARKLGTNKLFSFLGAFVFMMMPLTISQSITTQNDLFAALLFVLFIYKLMDVITWEQIDLGISQIMDIAMLGMLVAYAYMAKTSVCASMVMFMPWLLIARLLKKDSFKKLFGSVFIAIAGILIPISETLIRTYLSSGSLMTSTASGNIMVATKNVKYIIVNILKNFSLLITQNYFRPLNGFVYRIAIGLGQKWNVEVNNEAIAFHGFDFLHHMNMGDDMYSHDKTPSAFVAYFAVLAGVILIAMLIKVLFDQKMDQKERDALWLSIGFAVSDWLSMGFIMALLRWQPWGTRLMYPALAVTVIMSVNMLYLLLKHWKNLATQLVLMVLIILSTMLAVPSVTYNLEPAVFFAKHGCENRIYRYFAANYRIDGYKKLIELAMEDGATDVGMLISGDGYDYPMWLMLREMDSDAKLRHLIAEKANDALEKAPDCIFVIERDICGIGETYQYANTTYICIYQDEETGDCYLQRASNSSQVLAMNTLLHVDEKALK